MSQALAGKVVLVTAGARRIGAAITRRLHAAGAQVVVHHHTSRMDARALREELDACRPGSISLLEADLHQPDAPHRLIDGTLDRYGRLDVLVNNASTFYPTPLGRIDALAWDDLIGINVRAPLFLTQAAAPSLRQSGGCVVNITDIHAERPLAGYPVYSVAKAALAGLTRALALELGPEVRVNAVAPGPVLWPENEFFDESARRRIVSHTLLKRAGTAEDVAGAVHYLVAEAPYVTGQILTVDGGRTINL